MKRLDNYLRITLGLSALVWGASGRAGRWGSPMLTIAGAMKVAEGITGYRPMLQAMTSIAMRRKPTQSESTDATNESAANQSSNGGLNEAQRQSTGPTDSNYSSLR